MEVSKYQRSMIYITVETCHRLNVLLILQIFKVNIFRVHEKQYDNVCPILGIFLLVDLDAIQIP